MMSVALSVAPGNSVLVSSISQHTTECPAALPERHYSTVAFAQSRSYQRIFSRRIACKSPCPNLTLGLPGGDLEAQLPHSVSRDSGILISIVRLYDTRFSISKNGHPSADAMREPADDMRVFLDSCANTIDVLLLIAGKEGVP